MSQFILTAERGRFYVFKDGESSLNGMSVMSRRDPAIPTEWKPGMFYYNPFFDRRRVYIYRQDQKLVSTDGATASRTAFTVHERTWFEIIPQLLKREEIPAALNSMINAIPTQVKAISQAVMHHLGIRVPADFNPTNTQAWYDWLVSVRIPLNDAFKLALAHTLSYKVSISKDTEMELLSGKIMPPGCDVHIRVFYVREVVKRVREIHDSPYLKIRIPQEVLNKGMEAVKFWIQANSELSRQFILAKEPISEHVLETKVSRTSPMEIVGYYRDPTNWTWVNLWKDVPRTTNDLIREIMEEEHPENR